MAPPDRIRNIAVGLIVRDGRALVEVYPATERHGLFARAIGGGIEFGESAREAVKREFQEELGVVLTKAQPLAVTENIFEIGGRPGHEVVHVFAVWSPQLDDLAFSAEVAVLDNHTMVRWIDLDALSAGDPPFYPPGMAELASALRRGILSGMAAQAGSGRLDRLETQFSGIPFPHKTIGMPRRARRPAGKAIRP